MAAILSPSITTMSWSSTAGFRWLQSPSRELEQSREHPSAQALVASFYRSKPDKEGTRLFCSQYPRCQGKVAPYSRIQARGYARTMAESKLSTEEQVATIWSLGGLTIKQLAKTVTRGIGDDSLLDRAAALAFNFILALFRFWFFCCRSSDCSRRTPETCRPIS